MLLQFVYQRFFEFSMSDISQANFAGQFWGELIHIGFVFLVTKLKQPIFVRYKAFLQV